MSTSFSRHHGLASLSDYGIAARYQTHNKDAYDSVLIQKILEDLALLERVRDRSNHYSLSNVVFVLYVVSCINIERNAQIILIK